MWNIMSRDLCRSELIDSAWVVIVPGQKCMQKRDNNHEDLLFIFVDGSFLFCFHLLS